MPCTSRKKAVVEEECKNDGTVNAHLCINWAPSQVIPASYVHRLCTEISKFMFSVFFFAGAHFADFVVPACVLYVPSCVGWCEVYWKLMFFLHSLVQCANHGVEAVLSSRRSSKDKRWMWCQPRRYWVSSLLPSIPDAIVICYGLPSVAGSLSILFSRLSDENWASPEKFSAHEIS